MNDTDTAAEQRADDQSVAVDTSPGHDDANTQFWIRVRSRSRKRRRRIIAEAGKNALIGVVIICGALMIVGSSQPNTMTFTALPLSSANVIAFGSGLAAFITAIWVAVAVQTGSATAAGSSDLETMLVRLRVLSVGARVLSVGMTVLTACALAWYSGLPDHFDVVRVLAAVGGWALIMTVGADAVSLASDPEDGGLDRFQKVDPLLRTRNLLTRLGADYNADTARSVVRTLRRPRHVLHLTLTIMVFPAAATVIDSVLTPPDSAQLLGRFLFAVAFSLAAFAGWTLLSYLITDDQLVEAALISAGTALLIVTLTVDIVQAVLQQAPQLTPAHLARITLSVLLITVPPLFIHGVGAIPSRAPRASQPYRTPVITVVTALLLRRHRRQLAFVEPAPRSRWEPLTLIAVGLLPLPPVALLIANAALARLRTTPALRGKLLASTVRWVAALLLAAPVIALLIWALEPVK